MDRFSFSDKKSEENFEIRNNEENKPKEKILFHEIDSEINTKDYKKKQDVPFLKDNKIGIENDLKQDFNSLLNQRKLITKSEIRSKKSSINL